MKIELRQKNLIGFLKNHYIDLLSVLVVIFLTLNGYWGLGLVYYISVKSITYIID